MVICINLRRLCSHTYISEIFTFLEAINFVSEVPKNVLVNHCLNLLEFCNCDNPWKSAHLSCNINTHSSCSHEA